MLRSASGRSRSARMAFFTQEGQRHIASEIALTVGVELAVRAFDQNGGAASDTVDAPGVAGSIQLETDVVADMNVKGRRGLFREG